MRVGKIQLKAIVTLVSLVNRSIVNTARGKDVPARQMHNEGSRDVVIIGVPLCMQLIPPKIMTQDINHTSRTP